MSDDNEQKIRVKDRRMFNADGTLRAPIAEEVPAPEGASKAAGAEDNVVSMGSRERSSGRPGAAQASAARPGAAQAGAARPGAAQASVTEADPTAARREPEPPAEPARPAQPGLFGDLVHSLAYQAAMFMGLVRDPLGPQYPTDLRAARQSIDMLRMLKDKTRGNLTPDEATTLERILTDLQMQYVTISRGQGKI
jgi:hypothetical protein